MGMPSVLKMCKDSIARTPEEAIKMLYESKYHSTIILSSQRKKLEQQLSDILDEIKKRNSEIENINDQMLPSVSHVWNDIDGCLGVECIEISIERFETAAELLYVASNPIYEVLSDPEARKPLSMKALSSLALLGHLMTGKK